MADFFIRRPIVAMVISILIVILGTFSLVNLPISEYPEVSPPVIQVSSKFPGADSIAVEQSVATPVESQVNGVEDMIYMKSSNSSNGQMTLSVTFEVGTDVDIAQVNTQNRATLAEPSLPEAVKREGLKIKRSSPDLLMVIGLYSPNASYDGVFLSNYASINLIDSLARIGGVGEARNFTSLDYAMRIWVRPDKLAELGLTASDVIAAVREQNQQAPAGVIGAEPAPPGQEMQYTVDAGGLMEMPEEFENIIIRSESDGSKILLKDVARIEFGAQTYSAFARVKGAPGAVLGIYLAPGGNAIQTAGAIQAYLEEAKGRFPPDVEHEIIVDSTRPIKASMEEIVVTLFQALALVAAVSFLFLQSWRATIIPLVAIPVSLIGAFIFFPILGFTLNTLTMFGLVLAIGIVVDDAIVVLEATETKIASGLSPPEATRAAMKEVTGPVIGTTLIMLAVFLPVGFMAGLTGSLYKQFAITIAVSVFISSINALSLSPALCALLLRPRKESNGLLSRFFGAFNRGFDRVTHHYTGFIGFLTRRIARTIIILFILFGATFFLFSKLPGGFVPQEDRGYLFTSVELPAGASLQRTNATMLEVEKAIEGISEVESYCIVGGFSLMNGIVTSDSGSAFINLRDWKERTDPQSGVDSIARRLMGALSSLPQARVLAFGPPALPGFGSASGFTMQLQDRAGGTAEELASMTQQFIAAASQRPELTRMYSGYNVALPKIKLDLDREKARSMGVPINDVFNTLQAFLGGAYVNDIVRFGRIYRVFLQAEPEFTSQPSDIGEFYVRGAGGSMVPLSTLTQTDSGSGPAFTNRFNLYRSAEITGQPAPGFSSAEAIDALETVAAEVLPASYGYTWSGLTYQEIESEGKSTMIFAMAIVFVFLLLAALYESWSLPFAVLLCSPLVVLGAVSGLLLKGFDNNVYTQIGIITLIGLSAKSAILIVEFARNLQTEGMPYPEAATEAAKQRLRAIIMTVFSFAMGCIPLMLASGSGSTSRQIMGYAAVFGTLVSGLLGVIFWPVSYAFIRRLVEGKSPKAAAAKVQPMPPAKPPQNPEEDSTS